MARKDIAARDNIRSQTRRRSQASRRRAVINRTYALPFQSRHYTLFGISMLVILSGFTTLGFGSITLAPLLLILGYCVLLPFIFFWKAAPEKKQAISDQESRQP